MKLSNLLGIFFVFLFLSAIGIGVNFIQQQTAYEGRAKEAIRDYSLENSYVFVSPLTAKAGGQEKIRVTVFLLTSQGLGVPNKSISLSALTEVRITIVKSETNEMGQATFDLISLTPGRFLIGALVDGKTLPKTVFVNFK